MSATEGYEYVYMRTDVSQAQACLNEFAAKGYRVHTLERHQQTVDILFERQERRYPRHQGFG